MLLCISPHLFTVYDMYVFGSVALIRKLAVRAEQRKYQSRPLASTAVCTNSGARNFVCMKMLQWVPYYRTISSGAQIEAFHGQPFCHSFSITFRQESIVGRELATALNYPKNIRLGGLASWVCSIVCFHRLVSIRFLQNLLFLFVSSQMWLSPLILVVLYQPNYCITQFPLDFIKFYVFFLLIFPFHTDYVYFETSSSAPFLIRRIEELNKLPSGNVEAKVMCFYRRRDIPNPLVQLADKHQSKYTTNRKCQLHCWHNVNITEKSLDFCCQ